MPKHGKRYRQNLEKVDRETQYPPAEAVSILKSFQPAGSTRRSRCTSAPG